jgi:hypothetical protein
MNIEKIDLEFSKIVNYEVLKTLKNLQELIIYGCDDKKMRTICHICKNNTSLKSITSHAGSLTNLECFRVLPQLEYLNLPNQNITNIDALKYLKKSSI